LPMSNHDLQSCQLNRLNHWYLRVATAAFFNEIGSQKRTPAKGANWRQSVFTSLLKAASA
jgi:hypothetical protein